MTLKGEMSYKVELGPDAHGNLTRIDNALAGMPDRLKAVRAQLDNLYQQQAAAKAELGKPFPQEAELQQKSARLAELNALLDMDGSKAAPQQVAKRLAKAERPSVLDKLKVSPVRGTPDKSQKKKWRYDNMTNEERNTALYQKMSAEQETYRKWLLSQPPEEILHHTYEYTVREDVLMSLENRNLTDAQADALLKSPCPLEDVFREFEKRETDYMARGNSRDMNRLMSMLPFRSVSFSGLDDRKGHFVLIPKEEDRNQPLKKLRRSVRKNLQKSSEQSGPGTPKKKKQEREVR